MARGQDQAGHIKPQQRSHVITMDWTCAHSSASQIPEYNSILSLLQNQTPPRRREGQVRETLELTDLLTIIILNFKLEFISN